MKRISLMIAMCVMGTLSAMAQISVWDGSHAQWTQGTGTQNDPYLIENAAQLAHLAYVVNNGIDAVNSRVGDSTYWQLTTDIDLNGSSTLQWTPIGFNQSSDYRFFFSGHFDGNGHTISKLFIDTDTLLAVGLFGHVMFGSIKNVGIAGNSSITRRSSEVYTPVYAGAIAGRMNMFVIENCYSTASISAANSTAVSYPSAYAGGIVGYCTGGSITNCYNTGTLTATTQPSTEYAGGIVGNGSTIIKNCYNVGSVIANNTGGLTCDNSTTVINSYYLNTCGGAGLGTSKLAAFMKTAAFVDSLNFRADTAGIAAFSRDSIPPVNNGYPVLTWQRKQTDGLMDYFSILSGNFAIFPNPVSNGQITITHEQWETNSILEIYTVMGICISQSRLTGIETTIDISHVASGVYFVKVGAETKKIIVKNIH